MSRFASHQRTIDRRVAAEQAQSDRLQALDREARAAVVVEWSEKTSKNSVARELREAQEAEEAERAAAEEELRRVRRAQLMQLYAADHEREDAALRRRGLAYYTEVDGMQ